uniref:uncharacterized protein LOC122585066 n=1 Tax=Erigeron canadensis TaxID=72917 RepID=UPI001CB99442|nr:uncharacterized protein LOC122585066 [Erigeron canadensis]
MIRWILSCVTSTSFSICVNGNLHGFFKGRRGLRQGDPMSPYLYTLVMEVLTLYLQKKAALGNPCFRYHQLCEKEKLINLCFADDLFFFARGDTSSTSILMEVLNAFKEMSGLVPSLPKSTVFFCNVSDHVKQAILQILPFEEGKLHVRYLGVPLISTRLVYRDCKVLVERMEKRISDWRNKSLSFARRLQLINSVLSSLHTYWASVFILPKSIIADLERKMRGFLWYQGDMKRGKAKVSWKIVCLPKYEGGLGIRRIEDSNTALMAAHVWSIITNRKSLWVQWIHSNRLKGRSFWDVPLRAGASWGWRKLLQLRSTFRPFFYSRIGNGLSTSAWFDSWCKLGPLSSIITPRKIKRPTAWYDLYPVLIPVTPPNLSTDRNDTLIWRDENGVEKLFSASIVWDSIRYKQPEVWMLVRSFAKMDHVAALLDDIIAWLISISSGSSISSVVGRLVFAASAFFVWQERNNRLYSNKMRTTAQIRDVILSTVRSKLHGMKLKDTSAAKRLIEEWKLPSMLIMKNEVAE